MAVHYFSLSRAIPAERLLQISRTHWGIGNSLHWVLEASMDENKARTRGDTMGRRTLRCCSPFALDLRRTNPDKGSVRPKVKRAGWRADLLPEVLGPNAVALTPESRYWMGSSDYVVGQHWAANGRLQTWPRAPVQERPGQGACKTGGRQGLRTDVLRCLLRFALHHSLPRLSPCKP